uniref:Uncharacterized protein n=1 Tax=Trepomonas sp. PC1 TaxID=1076344 RepID=A0A146KH28_9EUKA|eukprot:JAP94559.1 hypothetical protein TPC1_12748 [Trepomonas sp. PC1]
MSDLKALDKKVDELMIVAQNKEKQNPQELVKIMRELVEVNKILKQAKSEYDLLIEEKEKLRTENQELKGELNSKNYQIVHLKSNLKTYLDKENE